MVKVLVSIITVYKGTQQLTSQVIDCDDDGHANVVIQKLHDLTANLPIASVEPHYSCVKLPQSPREYW